jgi:hypothetical protein
MTPHVFANEIVVQVDDIRLIDEWNTTPNVRNALYDARIVAVHSERASDIVERVRFMNPYWDHDKPSLTEVSATDRVFVLIHPVIDPGRSLRERDVEYVSDWAFTVDGEDGTPAPVPRRLPTDREVAALISRSLKNVDQAGLQPARSESTGARVGALVDAYNDPTSDIRKLLDPAAEPSPLDPSEALLTNRDYTQVEIGGLLTANGEYFIRLQTASGFDTGIAISDESRYTSATVALAAGEAIDISVWNDENKAFITEPITRLTYNPERAVGTDTSDMAVLLSIGGDDAAIDAQTTTIDTLLGVALENQGRVEIGDVTESES